jgi:hypothetical protein
MIDDDTLDCWTVNYGLDKTPHDLYELWKAGAPFGATIALKLAVDEIKRLRAEAEKR